jgi:hypothetical protein
MMRFPIDGKRKNIPNHKPVMVFDGMKPFYFGLQYPHQEPQHP